MEAMDISSKIPEEFASKNEEQIRKNLVELAKISNEGYQANLDGKKPGDNPHTTDANKSNAWLKGYNRGQVLL